MKTSQRTTSEGPPRAAAAAEPMSRTAARGGESGVVRSTAADRLQHSARMLAQRAQFEAAFGAEVQRQAQVNDDRMHQVVAKVATPGQIANRPRADRSVTQLYNRFRTEELPYGARPYWLRDVHFTYVSDKRGGGAQLHITFTDSDEPEQEKGRKYSGWLWFNAADGTWTWAGRNPNLDDDDLDYYKAEAIKWAREKEEEFLKTIPAHSRPENPFDQWV